MLVANKQNGERFSLFEIRAKETLLKIREHESFTCPGCHEPVLLRLGDKRIPHFAHKNDPTHCNSFSENESQYHLKGKMQLFNWLAQQHLAIELEPYLPSIQQRPDILLHDHGRTFVIEYQCSIISAQIFNKRTTSYISNGYIPIWILGASNLNRKSSLSTKISSFQWLFAQNSMNLTHLPSLLYFCPLEKKFIRLSNLYPFSPTDLISNISITPLEKPEFKHLFYEPQADIDVTEIWLAKKKKWRRTSTPFLMKSARKFATELYQHHIPPSCIPAEVGLPVKSLYWIETHVILWQMYILMDSIYPARIGDFITFQTVYQKFQSRKAKGLIKIRTLPLITDTHYSFAIMEYLNVLEKIGVIKKVKGSTFKKSKEIATFTNLEEAEKQDMVFLENLKGIY